MTDTYFFQPDLGPLRAAAKTAELAQAAAGLLSIDGCRLAGSDPAGTARPRYRPLDDRSGPDVHHRARRYPLYRLGGVCLARGPGRTG
jgi:hypothetical protein